MAAHWNKSIETHVALRALLTRRDTLRLAFFVMMVAVTFPCRCEEDAEGEMAKIAAAHKHWRESIVSVRMVWEIVPDSQSQFAKDNGLQGVESRSQTEFIWCDDGRHRVYSFGQIKKGPEIGRTLSCADGNRSFSVIYAHSQSDMENPDRIEVLSQPIPGQGGSAAYVPLMGLWFGNRNYWLGDMVTHKFVTFDGYEAIDDEKTPRIKVQRTPERFVSLILAPNHGYLARRFVAADWHNEITSFRLIEPGVWFPWTGSFRSKFDAQTWEMKEIQVNSHLDPKLFQPPIGPRTLVIDTMTGQRSGPGSVAKEPIASQTSQNLKPGENPATARPPNAGTVRWMLVASFVSLAFFGVGAWLKRRV